MAQLASLPNVKQAVRDPYAADDEGLGLAADGMSGKYRAGVRYICCAPGAEQSRAKECDQLRSSPPEAGKRGGNSRQSLKLRS